MKSSIAMRQFWWVAQCVALLLLTPATALGEEVINLVSGGSYGYSKIYDISIKIVPGMLAWNTKPVGFPGEKLRHLDANGQLVYVLFSHLGTHTDAPGHVFDDMLKKGEDVTKLSLNTLNGLCLVMDTPRHTDISAEVLKSMNIPAGVKRLLLRTENTFGNWMRNKEFNQNYTGLTADGADWLVKNTGIKLIGMDYLSVAAQKDVKLVHQALLRSGDIIPVEGMDLTDVPPGEFILHCLPLRIPGSDGSPARCVLMQ